MPSCSILAVYKYHTLLQSKHVEKTIVLFFCVCSHDFHVFMQTLIPLAYRNLLLKRIWDALTEIIQFFRDICSNKLHAQLMKKLEMNIVQKICKLEMVFPPSFFNLMRDLPIYLLLETKVGGPVQRKQIYPFERLRITHVS